MPRDKPLYCCFSVPQQKFLTSKNIHYEVVALNPNTKCTMWIYMRNEKLDKALNEWRLSSKS
nr:MAG TPA: hypothetical protein [Caudoviricetes sp.]